MALILKTCECTGTVPFNSHDQTQLLVNGKKVLLSKAESNMIYKELRNRVIINLNWKKIYSLPFRVTLDTKSREFKYKLLKRCIATNAFLCQIGMLSLPACPYCEETDESLEHLFVSCHYPREFWAEVIKWFSDFNIDINQLSDKNIMLGILDCKDYLFVNHILLIAKRHTYKFVELSIPDVALEYLFQGLK